MVLYTTLSPEELANIVAHYEIGTHLSSRPILIG
jgi:hypothetical protein